MATNAVQFKKQGDLEVPKGSWTSKVNIVSAVPVSGVTPVYSASIDLASNNYERIHIQIKATWPGSPVDDLKFIIQTSLDDATFDDEYSSFILSKTMSGKAYSFQVENVPVMRIGVAATGTTDTITLDTIDYRAQ